MILKRWFNLKTFFLVGKKKADHVLFLWIELRIWIWHVFGRLELKLSKNYEIKPPFTNYSCSYTYDTKL